MDFGYDIFRKLDDGTPIWVTQVGSLDDGKNLIHALSSATPGEYFIRDASTGEIIFKAEFPQLDSSSQLGCHRI